MKKLVILMLVLSCLLFYPGTHTCYAKVVPIHETIIEVQTTTTTTEIVDVLCVEEESDDPIKKTGILKRVCIFILRAIITILFL